MLLVAAQVVGVGVQVLERVEEGGGAEIVSRLPPDLHSSNSSSSSSNNNSNGKSLNCHESFV